MYKLLIADDEEIEINAFRVIIGNNFDNIVVFSAENGIEAIDLARKENPDIIFMDIQMPGLDGLSSIEEIKKTAPFAHVIVHTAYSNFEYAQRAIKIGADDYLLKPVKMDNMIETIKKNIEKIEMKKTEFSNFQKLEEKLLQVKPFIEKDVIFSVINGLEGHDILSRYISLYEIKMEKAFCAIFRVMQIQESGTSVEEAIKRKSEIAKKVVETLKQVCQCIAAEYVSGVVLAIIPLHNSAAEYDTRIWSMNLASYIRSKLKGTADICAGIGGLCSRFENIHQSYTEAYKVLSEDTLMMSIKHYADFKNDQENVFESLSELETQICQAIMMRDKNEILRVAVNIFDTVVGNENNISHIKSKLFETCAIINRYIELNTLNSILISSDQNIELLASIANLDTLQKWFMDYIVKVINEVGKTAKKHNSSIVSDVKKYIDENYDKDISLEAVAAKICVTPYYLSRLFKKEMGNTFNNYVTEVRINKAKHLLRNTHKSIKEVCFDTGFNSQPYFCMVFKKLEGMSPSEYVQSLKK